MTSQLKSVTLKNEELIRSNSDLRTANTTLREESRDIASLRRGMESLSIIRGEKVRLTSQLAKSEAARKTDAAELEDERAERAALEVELVQSKAAREADRVESKKERAHLEAKSQEVEAFLGHIKKRVDTFTSERAEHEAERARFVAERKRFEDAFRGARKERDAVATQLAEESERLNSVRREREVSEKQLAALARAYEALKGKNVEAKAMITSLAKAHMNVEQERDRLRSELDKSLATVAAVTSELDATRTEKRRAEEGFRMIESERSGLAKKLEVALSERKELGHELFKAKQWLNAKKEENGDLSDRVDRMEKAHHHFAAKNAALVKDYMEAFA